MNINSTYNTRTKKALCHEPLSPIFRGILWIAFHNSAFEIRILPFFCILIEYIKNRVSDNPAAKNAPNVLLITSTYIEITKDMRLKAFPITFSS